MTAVLGTNVSAGVAVGSHLCALFSSDAERLELLRSFFGARTGERLVLVTPADAPPLPDDLLPGLELRRPEDVYLTDGRLDPAATVAAYGDEIEAAQADGFARLRVAADMSWVLAHDVPMATLLAYESAVNRLFPGGRAAGMCLYDDRRFHADDLTATAEVHPFTAEAHRRGARGPFTASRDTDGTLHLRGEIDYFGASHLGVLVSDSARGGADVVIDMSGVRFIDAAALEALQDAASRLCEGSRVVLRSPSRLMRRLLALLPGAQASLVTAEDGAAHAS